MNAHTADYDAHVCHPVIRCCGWPPFDMDGVLDDYDPAPSLVARGVMADPAEHDPESCDYACCVTSPGVGA